MSSSIGRRAETIKDVVKHIDDVVDWAIDNKSRIGFFAALYHHVAVAFERAIAAKQFDDPARMERLDVVFFNRYLAALDEMIAKKKPTRAWATAFDAARDPRPVTVQHLVLGMNAHINLDLGIAVAETMPHEHLADFEADFDKMNALLASLLGDVMKDLSIIWPALGAFNRIFGREESLVVDFSMREARANAWKSAVTLTKLHKDARQDEIHKMDALVSELGRVVWRPGVLADVFLRLVHAAERGDVVARIRDILR
jgi:hypothetical protein